MGMNFHDSPKWITAVVSDRVGHLSYLILLLDGDMWRRRIDISILGLINLPIPKRASDGNATSPPQGAPIKCNTTSWKKIDLLKCHTLTIYITVLLMKTLDTNLRFFFELSLRSYTTMTHLQVTKVRNILRKLHILGKH